MATNIEDKKDGTGVLISLASVSGTAVVSIAKYLGDVSRNVFTTAITTTVPVTEQSVTLAVGSYVAVTIDASGPSSPIGFRVTDGTLGTHERCLHAIREHIIALSLPSFPSDDAKHKLHKRPINTFLEFSSWAGSGRQNQAEVFGVHYWNRPERVRQIMNQRHGIEYSVEMVLVRSRNMTNVSDPDWTHDRERIIGSFPACPLPAVPEVYAINFVPGLIYADTGNGADVEAQSIKFTCLCEKPSVSS